MAYTETVTDGVSTRTYSDGRTESRSVYGDSSKGGGKVTTTRERTSSPGGGRVALTPEQIALEEKRIQEEIKQYGEYTPLQYDPATGEYYQTAPTLSPSIYLQPPDSDEGRRITSRHPAGEKAYAPSSQWLTPGQAEKEIQQGLDEGRYTERYIGYKREIGVRGEGGIAWYPDEVVRERTIQKEPISGVGLDYGPSGERYKELGLSSVVSEMIGSGAAVLGPKTEYGYTIQLTPFGQASQKFWSQQLQGTMPSYYLLQGGRDKFQIEGMPYTLTTTTEPGKITRTKTDYYGKVVFQEIDLTSSPIAGPQKTSSQLNLLVAGQPTTGQQLLSLLPRGVQGKELDVSPPTEMLMLGMGSGVNAPVPGMTFTAKKAEPTQLENWLTTMDKGIEESPLGLPTKAGRVAAGALGTGINPIQSMEASGGVGRTAVGFVRALPGGDKFVIATDAMVNIARTDFSRNLVGTFSSMPEVGAKLVGRVAPAPGIAFKAVTGMPLSPFEQQYGQTAALYGGVIGAGVVGFAAGFGTDPLGQAAVGGKYIATTLVPSFLGANVWGAPVEVAGRGIAGAVAKAREPTQIKFTQLEDVGGSGRFMSTSRVKTRIGQFVPDDEFVMGYYAGNRPAAFTGKGVVVSQTDDLTQTAFGGYGVSLGQRGATVSVGRGYVFKPQAEPYMPGIADYRRFISETEGFAVQKGVVMASVNRPAEIVMSAGKPLLMKPGSSVITGVGLGTPVSGRTAGIVVKVTDVADDVAVRSFELPTGLVLSKQADPMKVFGVTKVASPSGKIYSIPTTGYILPVELTGTTAKAGAAAGAGSAVSTGGMVLKTSQITAAPKMTLELIQKTSLQLGSMEAAYGISSRVGSIASAGGIAAGIGGAGAKAATATISRTATLPVSIVSLAPAQRTAQASVPKVATLMITAPDVSQSRAQSAATLSLQQVGARQLPRLKEATVQVPAMREALLPKVSLVQVQGVGQALVQMSAVGTMTATVTDYGRVGTDPPPRRDDDPPPPIFGGGFGFAGMGFGPSKIKVPQLHPAKTAYKPSLLGIAAGMRIKKAPKMVSGAEWARGIVVGAPKKKKKGRRRR